MDPRTPPIEEILVGIEKAVRSLPVEQAEEARHESVRIIKTSTRPKNNLTKNERTALTALKDNTHLTILPADKGNATVILNTTDYKQKIEPYSGSCCFVSAPTMSSLVPGTVTYFHPGFLRSNSLAVSPRG